MNKENNWLLAITLNSFSKFAENQKLSDLETVVVQAFQRNGFSDEEIKKHGELGEQIPQDMRNAIFPEKFARLDVKSSYSMNDMRRDAEGIVRTFRARPNVTNVDVSAIHAKRATLRDFPRIKNSVLREHASEALVVVEPDAAPAPRAAAAGQYTIKATRFKCIERAGDSIFNRSNEAYWIFGSLGGGTPVTTRSPIFEGVDSGESRTFSATAGCIWGQNCVAQALPEGEVASLVQLWEHDEGKPDQIKAGVAAAFAAAAGILAATGVAAWVGAVVVGVGAVVQWLLGFLDDDHIADQTFVFSSAVLQKQIPNAGQALPPVVRKFTDGDADYDLTIQVTHVS
ncbi:hypothetical protein [Murinocardiopsis flavida]|uniref:hypothetical protein n=1 Tax=Murinocardiopsis flavida TaxID=645275 RepID=UPI001FE624E6|nr:hypothetical protein [Murinocardiopsis flavida]